MENLKSKWYHKEILDGTENIQNELFEYIESVKKISEEHNAKFDYEASKDVFFMNKISQLENKLEYLMNRLTDLENMNNLYSEIPAYQADIKYRESTNNLYCPAYQEYVKAQTARMSSSK